MRLKLQQLWFIAQCRQRKNVMKYTFIYGGKNEKIVDVFCYTSYL
jgi:hypothetical protein